MHRIFHAWHAHGDSHTFSELRIPQVPTETWPNSQWPNPSVKSLQPFLSRLYSCCADALLCFALFSSFLESNLEHSNFDIRRCRCLDSGISTICFFSLYKKIPSFSTHDFPAEFKKVETSSSPRWIWGMLSRHCRRSNLPTFHFAIRTKTFYGIESFPRLPRQILVGVHEQTKMRDNLIKAYAIKLTRSN